MKLSTFADRLYNAIEQKNAPICVGLDPFLEKLPSHILTQYRQELGDTMQAITQAILSFNCQIIDAVADIVPAVKPQIAFYEQYGIAGLEAYRETCLYAQKKGLLVIADVKRNDIASTAQAYAQAYLGKTNIFGQEIEMFPSDAVTINAYLGKDGIEPFIQACKIYSKGVFVLVRTSNPSARDFQDKTLIQGATLFEAVAEEVNEWSKVIMGECGFSSIGAVVGATYPEQAKRLRQIMPNTFFLVPGYGAQGATAKEVEPCFIQGKGAIVNASRSILYAFDPQKPEQFADEARKAAVTMQQDILSVL
ncbi:MAG: orotidine-5'-phosphate decarboxylase [Bacteroidia bacterium]|nr:orotidine-5'-phosphate decarboxylase [Bacteroidia bacterium]MDW8346390.1 orotidine-5'-phosphate decarboxylase [Bacteroidia bacterium]